MISNDAHHDRYAKYVCLAVTSQEKAEGTKRYQHKLNKTINPSVGLLFEDQWVLPNKVFSIENSIIIKRLGTMDQADFDAANSMFYAIFE